MRKNKIVLFILILTLFLLTLCSCSVVAPTETITVRIIDVSGYSVYKNDLQVCVGDDAEFVLRLQKGATISSVGYDDYEIDEKNRMVELKLKNVQKTQDVSVKASFDYITYDANGGETPDGSAVMSVPCVKVHLRENTILGSDYFERDGYVLSGWNTAKDGSGEKIGLGSRVANASDLTLYADWEKESDAQLFDCVVTDHFVEINRYIGNEKTVVVPKKIEGLPVVKINSFSFTDKRIDKLVLHEGIKTVAENAFKGSLVEELTLYDSLTAIYASSFDEGAVKTLRINAVEPPVYSGSYYDTFSDKLDRLISLENSKKIVLFSGSSSRFGYDSEKIDAQFTDYEVVNMGVYAYTNALPQLHIIEKYMKAGDVLLDSPEFDIIEKQFCVTNELDEFFFNMAESDYDAVALLDMRFFSNVFGAFSRFLYNKHTMTPRSYEMSPSEYDEDMQSVAEPSYNEYGDYIIYRPNEEKDEMHRFIPCEYTKDVFDEEIIDSINNAFKPFLKKGIFVYFSYAPRNRSSLTENSNQSTIAEMDKYLQEKISVPVISQIQDYIYSGIYFYEIDNHLSTEGVAMRTSRIIEDLKKVI